MGLGQPVVDEVDRQERDQGVFGRGCRSLAGSEGSESGGEEILVFGISLADHLLRNRRAIGSLAERGQASGQSQCCPTFLGGTCLVIRIGGDGFGRLEEADRLRGFPRLRKLAALSGGRPHPQGRRATVESPVGSCGLLEPPLLCEGIAKGLAAPIGVMAPGIGVEKVGQSRRRRFRLLRGCRLHGHQQCEIGVFFSNAAVFVGQVSRGECGERVAGRLRIAMGQHPAGIRHLCRFPVEGDLADLYNAHLLDAVSRLDLDLFGRESEHRTDQFIAVRERDGILAQRSSHE